jgi:hypothetical protein
MVRTPAYRLHLRARRQLGTTAIGWPARRGRRFGPHRPEGETARRYGDFRYAAKSWTVKRRVIARMETGPQGADSRFMLPICRACPGRFARRFIARGQAENLTKTHKLHLTSDHTSCTKATANQFRLLIHATAYWLLLTLRGPAPGTSFWRYAQFDTIRLCLIKVPRASQMVTRIKVALPSAFPYQTGFAGLTGRIAKLPP